MSDVVFFLCEYHGVYLDRVDLNYGELSMQLPTAPTCESSVSRVG